MRLRLAIVVAICVVTGSAAAVTFGPDTTSTGVNTGQGTVTAGLQCDASSDPVTCNGYLASALDGTMLDVTVWTPRSGSKFPLVTGIHGWGGSKHSNDKYAKQITAAGFAFLSYSARGFGDSYGQTNLADVNVEAVDLRSMIGQVVDDRRLRIDPSAVAVFGASYGGAHSYLAAIRPVFTSPRGRTITIRTVAPLVPWSELTGALRPNGRIDDPIDPAGGFKFSYAEGLYIGGCKDGPVCSNYPLYLTEWNAWMAATEPNNITPIDRQIVDGFSGYRSIFWQNEFWDGVKANRLPIFLGQGWTDDLFPVEQALRMVRALKLIDPNYPIALYLGDVGHPRARNKPGEVDYVINQLIVWLQWFLKGEGTQPAFDVQAAITRPKDVPFDPNDVIRVASYDDLATSTVTGTFAAPQVLTFDPANNSGVFWDPLVMTGSEELAYFPQDVPADEVPGDVAVYEMPVASPMLIAGQPVVTMNVATIAPRVQLDARLFDVKPGGTKQLVTRGTFTLEGGSQATITTYGNVWPLAGGDTLRLEITNVDSPYIAPSKVPSVSVVSDVVLTLPVR